MYEIRHWEDGKIKFSDQGLVTWVNYHLGEFVFSNQTKHFWGKTDYWEVIEFDPRRTVGKIIVK